MPNTQHSIGTDTGAILEAVANRFACGLPEEEALEVVPKLHPMRAFFRSEYRRLESERRVRNTAIMCGNG